MGGFPRFSDDTGTQRRAYSPNGKGRATIAGTGKNQVKTYSIEYVRSAEKEVERLPAAIAQRVQIVFE